MAIQVSNLLNLNNKLGTTHTKHTIMSNNIDYFIELYGQTVVGCIGLQKQINIDKIMHLSVLSTMRRKGIGKRLIEKVLNESNQSVIYMSVRDDNIGSINLSLFFGFKIMGYIPKQNYNILNMCLFRR